MYTLTLGLKSIPYVSWTKSSFCSLFVPAVAIYATYRLYRHSWYCIQLFESKSLAPWIYRLQKKLTELQTSIKDTKNRTMELLNLALTPLAKELNKWCHQRSSINDVIKGSMKKKNPIKSQLLTNKMKTYMFKYF